MRPLSWDAAEYEGAFGILLASGDIAAELVFLLFVAIVGAFEVEAL